MKILPQKLPGTQDLALMVIYANTDDHSESRYKGHNECCGAQLSELMEMYMFGKTLHPRSVYYPITCLCIDRLIEKSNEDSDHESHLLGHGKRTFYRLTDTGIKRAELLWELYGHLYGPEYSPI